MYTAGLGSGDWVGLDPGAVLHLARLLVRSADAVEAAAVQVRARSVEVGWTPSTCRLTATGGTLREHAADLVARVDSALRPAPPVPCRGESLGGSKGGWRSVGHLLLDGAGMVPVLGEVADGANALWYLAEGIREHVGLSLEQMRASLLRRPYANAMSRFYSQEAAARTVSDALNSNINNLFAWMATGAPRIEIMGPAARAGDILLRDGRLLASRTSRVIIKPAADWGYHVRTVMLEP